MSGAAIFFLVGSKTAYSSDSFQLLLPKKVLRKQITSETFSSCFRTNNPNCTLPRSPLLRQGKRRRNERGRDFFFWSEQECQ